MVVRRAALPAARDCSHWGALQEHLALAAASAEIVCQGGREASGEIKRLRDELSETQRQSELWREDAMSARATLRHLSNQEAVRFVVDGEDVCIRGVFVVTGADCEREAIMVDKLRAARESKED